MTVQHPPAREYAAALAESVHGMIRPRLPDQRLLDSIEDAGLPRARRTVTVRALPQVPRRVPGPGIIEGRRSPRAVRNTMTSFVVEHPEARFIVDPAICRDARTRVLREMPAPLRAAVTPPSTTVATVDLLGHTARQLDFALATHAHWDHVSGLLDLPGLPVHLRETERDWVLAGEAAPVAGVRSALAEPRPVVTFELDGPPVATFTASHDLFGEGSVVLVDLAGHTPGSVGVLLHTEAGWVLIAGDAAWHHEQVELIRQKPGFPGRLVDVDREAAFATLHRLHLARHLARVVPTHDHDSAAHLMPS
ncbi:MBL fold metallo-hydrolase [Nocardioides speluncae]|uniref:MBL fold metallo-hydrolase n=1 Tax=Nocardioides speluncae TaxID=2670337 RepID=UPI000D69A50E|nr:MBL fold metallo-hydrolase [Nocardioides speluncae]